MWTPQPRVDWKQITHEAISAPPDGYRILVEQPTRGLFPANMSVSRVAIREDDEDGTHLATPHLVRDPRNEFLRWNTAFDDQMALSSVFPIAQQNLGGADASPEMIVAAMRALGARLGFVYAVNELSETRTEMIGVLYETAADKPIAFFRAAVESVVPPKGARRRRSVDPWKTDSKALVRAEFERVVRAGVRDLIAHDDPAEVETPEGWVPEGPLMPAEWPPRLFQFRRGFSR